jgi:hypothetical protein
MYGIRRNPQQKKEEPKIFAVFHIDDRNLGIPLMMEEGCNRPCVDWKEVRKIMIPILEEISSKLEKAKL